MEGVTQEGRAALAELQHLLEGLGVHVSQPPPVNPDAKTCFRLLREGLRVSASALTSLGNACGLVSWTTFLCGLRTLGYRDLPLISELERLGRACLDDTTRFWQLQEVVKAATREIGTKFWAPFGRTLVRRRLQEAAEQKAARQAAKEGEAEAAATTTPATSAECHPEPAAPGPQV